MLTDPDRECLDHLQLHLTLLGRCSPFCKLGILDWRIPGVLSSCSLKNSAQLLRWGLGETFSRKEGQMAPAGLCSEMWCVIYSVNEVWCPFKHSPPPSHGVPLCLAGWLSFIAHRHSPTGKP